MKTLKFKVHMYVDVPAKTEGIDNEEVRAATMHVKNMLEAHLEHLSAEMHRFKVGRISIDYMGTSTKG